MTPLSQVWPEDFADRYRRKKYWRGETFSQMLRQRAAEQPDATCLIAGKIRWTYKDLLDRAETAAAGFLALGLVPGDRVIVQLPNIADFLPVIFGLFRARLIPVYALPAHRITEIAHFARKSEARGYIIADRHDGFDYRALARDVQAEVAELQHVVVIGDAQEFHNFSDFRAQPDRLPTEDANPSDVAFLQISGGSTGLSKLIPRTHDDYLYSVRESAVICGLEPESVFLTALPAAHNFPMSSPGYLGALYVGATIVMAPSPSPDVCFPLIERERVTITGLVPPLALLWLQAAARNTHDLSSLQVLLVGGAKFLPEAARRIRPELGCTLQQVFGMAEGLVNYTRLDDLETIIVETQGRPICDEDDEILIVDDEGNPVPEGTPGNLLTRGPYTIRAYHNDPAANARSFTADGYYRTGDIVRRTPEGNLIVMGRATDHINRAGEKISAEEVEDHLLAHPSVFDAAVVSVPDAYLGERICAFIIPQGNKPRGVDIKAWMRKRGIADFKVPDQIVFTDDFAVTAVGKISRRELRATLRQQLLTSQEDTK